jgi:hypothetical protein
MSRKGPVDTTPDLVRTVASPVKLKLIPVKDKGQKYPYLGAGLISGLYSAIAEVGPVKSGKTSVIFNILDQCAGPETVVLIFSQTIHSDKGWMAILEWLDQNNIPHAAKTSIYAEGPEGKHNFIKDFMQGCIAQGAIDEAKRDNEGKAANTWRPGRPIGGNWHEPVDTKKEFLPTLDPYLVKVDKVKYQYAPFIVVLDDIAEEMRDPQVGILIRQYRHWHAKVIVSSQHFVDAQPAARQNIQDWFLFESLDRFKLQTIYGVIPHARVDFDRFQRRYHDATAEKYGFLHIDVDNRTMKKGTEKEYLKLGE